MGMPFGSLNTATKTIGLTYYRPYYWKRGDASDVSHGQIYHQLYHHGQSHSTIDNRTFGLLKLTSLTK